MSDGSFLFVPLSAPRHKLETDWAEVCCEVILRSCPVCEGDSIISHGRRRKQAHDKHHDRIGIRRRPRHGCGKTFTFVPPLSATYTALQLPGSLPGIVALRGALLWERGGA